MGKSKDSAVETSVYRYWAFISYSSKNKPWARWLHRTIETYGIPAQLVHHATPTGEPAPKRFHPLFHDRAELPAASDLGAEIEGALRASRYLIVVCSPYAARSSWVNKEIETFHSFGRHQRVLAIIVDGEPNAGDERECFPPALRMHEPIAADARAEGDGRTSAKLKLLAGMLGVSFDALKQRDSRRHIRRLQYSLLTTFLIALIFACLAWYANHQRDRKVEALNVLTQENYFNTIALADSRIRDHYFERAEALLWATPEELRSWEWGHLMYRARQEVLSFPMESGQVQSLAFSPHGRFLITSTSSQSDQKAALMSLRTEAHVVDLSIQKEVFSIDVSQSALGQDTRIMFSLDEKYLIAKDLYSPNVRVITLPSGRIAFTISDLPSGAEGVQDVVVLSPDGKHLASLHTDNKIRIWDLSTGREVGSFVCESVSEIAYSSRGTYLIAVNHTSASVYDCLRQDDFASVIIRCQSFGGNDFAFSQNDDRLLLIGPEENRATVYDLPHGNARTVLQGHTNQVVSVAWSPDGTMIATGSNETKIWDATTGQIIRTLPRSASAVAFSPDSRLLGAIARDQDVHQSDGQPSIKALWIYDLQSGKETSYSGKWYIYRSVPPFDTYWQLLGHRFDVTFSPDGRRAWWYRDGMATITSTKTGDILEEQRDVRGFTFSPDGELVAAVTEAGKVRLWKVGQTASDIRFKLENGSMLAATFSKDARRLFTITGEYGRGWNIVGELWDIDIDGSRLAAIPIHANYGYDLSPVSTWFSCDGNRFVVPTTSGTVEVRDVTTGSIFLELKVEYLNNDVSVAISPDGRRIVAAVDYAEVNPYKHVHVVHIWDAETGQQLHRIQQTSEATRNIAFSPDGQRIIEECHDATYVWDSGTGTLLLKTEPLLFSGDSRRIMVEGKDFTVPVYDVNSTRRLFTLSGHTGAIRCMSISHDGNLLVTTSDDGTARIWSGETGVEMSHLRTVDKMTSGIKEEILIEFLPADHHIATVSDKETLIWDFRNGHVVMSLNSNKFVFSSDEKRVIAAEDGRLVCRDLVTGKEVLRLTGHSGEIMWVSQSPDGTRLLTSDSDGNAIVRKILNWKSTMEETDR